MGTLKYFTQASTIKTEATKWFWQDYLPIGKIAMLDGDPGQGKSTLTLDLAARVTNGKEFSGSNNGGCEPANLMILNCDDNAKDTIVPRLAAFGANLSHAYVFSGSGEVPIRSCQRDTAARLI